MWESVRIREKEKERGSLLRGTKSACLYESYAVRWLNINMVLEKVVSWKSWKLEGCLGIDGNFDWVKPGSGKIQRIAVEVYVSHHRFLNGTLITRRQSDPPINTRYQTSRMVGIFTFCYHITATFTSPITMFTITGEYGWEISNSSLMQNFKYISTLYFK